MFHRKDVVPLVFLVLVIITIMVTLSQILVVHNKHHHVHTEPRDYQKFKDILVQLEGHINSMLKKNVLPLHKYRKAFAAQIYKERINFLLYKESIKQHVSKKPKSLKRASKRNIVEQEIILQIKQTEFHTRRKLSRIDNEIRDGKRILSRSLEKSSVNWSKYQMGYKYSTVTKQNTNNHIAIADDFMGANETSLPLLRSLLIRDREVDNDSLSYSMHQRHDGAKRFLPRIYSPGTDTLSLGFKQEYGPKQSGIVSKSHRKRERYKMSCPDIPPDLVGRIRITTTVNVTRLTFSNNDDVLPGGHWKPVTCIPRHKVAIIIPYRDRRTHLHKLLFYLIPILKRQQIEFRIFVIEQAGHRTFNKGMVMNAGFKEAVRMSDFHCYVFHDVDLIPEDDRNMYSCPGFPRHLSVAVDKFRYHLPYSQLVGGVFAIRREDFETVNGYSNLYWGWGAEDDDMSIRLAVAGMKLSRPSATIARYKMLKHNTRERAPVKWSAYLLKTVKKRFNKDGLSTVSYNVTFIHLEPFYTHIMVDIGDPPRIVGNISAIIR